jgi:outer membrane receptor protein involved in Fe transport
MTNLRARLRRDALFVTAGVAAMVVAMPAMAQSTPEEEKVDVTTAAAGEENPERAITVTGSRIRNPNLTGFAPTTTIDREFIDQRNFINVADAINTLPQIRGSVTPNGDQAAFGQGVNFINNFGLGSNRTLTLINGRRVVSSNPPSLFGPGAAGTQVDVNIIPTALVKAVDIASAEGAPIYGSDAIAGTVNFVLDDKYEGLSLNATSGIYEEGDGHSFRFEGVYGTKFAGGRGHMQMSAFYTYTDGILQSQRQDFLNELTVQPNLIETGRLAPGVAFDTGPTDGNPASVVFRGLGLFPLSNTGVIFGGPLGVTTATNRPTGAVGNQAFQFDAAGNLVPYNVGTRVRALIGGVATPSGNNSIFGDGFRFSDFGQLTSDLRRFGANLFANYDVTDKINVFVEAQYFDSRANELVQQPTFNTPLFGGASGALTFNIDNPFLSPQARGVLQGAGVTNFTLSRANVGFADLTGFAETEFMRGVVGARGDFKLFKNDWNWETSFNYGKSNITDFRQDINVQNFVNATNVARNAAGQIVCAANLGPVTTPAQTPNTAAGVPAPVADNACAPFNFFGNQASAAALDYVTSDNVTQTNLEQIVFNANLGGTLFKFNNNDVSVNGGYEFRREQGSFIPSEFEQLGRGRGAAVTPINGEYTLNEFFGEVLVPLITPENDMLFESAVVYGRGRYVDNTVNGGFFSWAAGGSVAPIQDIEFRGNFTRSFRAPALTELFLPQANAFGFVPDLCMPGAVTGGANPAARQRNCQAFLTRFPGVQRPQQASVASVPIIVGGNPTLENEQADSYSVGGIFRPRFLRNFSLTVDYINIAISNPISQLNTAQINSACFDNDTFNTADPANGNPFCSLISRTATGEVVNDPANPGVRTGFQNGNRIDYEGIQGALLYATSLDGIGMKGTLQFAGNLTVVLRRQIDITGVAPARSDAVIGDPTWAGQFTMNYTNKNWGIGTVFQYVGEQLFSRFDRNPDARQFDKLNAFVTTDLNLFYRTDDNFRFNFAVRNLFDRRCQEIAGFCIPAARNDVFGRQFTVNVTKEF